MQYQGEKVLTFSNLTQISPATLQVILVRKVARKITGSIVYSALLIQIGQRLDGALVVGPVALVDERHRSIALEVGDGNDRSVDGELLVVGTETVAVGVGVGEETGLEDGVGGRLDIGDHVGGRKGGLMK
jgi:hypothetical protein